MKPEYEKISEPLERSFTAKYVKRPSRPLLSQAWHYHPEIEICFTLESAGKRFVGNQIADYSKGDLVMFGSNLPHGFTTDYQCLQVVIQMNEQFLGSTFLSRPEVLKIQTLFGVARRGIEFGSSTKKEAEKIILVMMKKEGFEQMIELFRLLHLLSCSEDMTFICSEKYSYELDATHLNRIKQVYDYILVHYQRKIDVPTMAAELNLTEPTFYKFIKKHTKKTFTRILNEFRINLATKHLMNTDKSIAEICFSCGYNNVSYFNRKFREIVGKTPGEFKRSYGSPQSEPSDSN